jgi:hypothetical protein
MRATARTTTARPRTVNADPGRELTITLSTLTLFQGAVQHADDKARTVVAIQTALTAMVAAEVTFLVDPQPTGSARIGLLVVLAVFVSGYLQSTSHLLRALIPRTATVSGRNQFAFPSVASDVPSVARLSLREQCVHAAEVGRVLANIAMVKHRHVRRAMYGTGALFISALSALVTTAVW